MGLPDKIPKRGTQWSATSVLNLMHDMARRTSIGSKPDARHGNSPDSFAKEEQLQTYTSLDRTGTRDIGVIPSRLISFDDDSPGSCAPELVKEPPTPPPNGSPGIDMGERELYEQMLIVGNVDQSGNNGHRDNFQSAQSGSPLETRLGEIFLQLDTKFKAAV